MGVLDQPEDPEDGEFEYPIIQKEPDDIWFAIRVTALMTQLERNVANRRGGLQSMSQEAHTQNEDIVTAGLMITTIADEVRFEHHDEIQDRGLGTDAVSTVVDKLSETTTTREGASSNLDGLSLIVFDYDGMSDPEIYQNSPAPDPESRLFYDNFISHISDLIDQRFLGLPDPQSADAEAFINRNEGLTIEFKEEIPDARELAKEAIAMINSAGGVILIGVTDEGSVAGVDDPDDVQNRAANILREYIEDAPEITWDIDSIDGDDVVLIRLPEAEDRLYSLDGTFYTRFGESKMPMRFREMKQFVINWLVDRHRLNELVS